MTAMLSPLQALAKKWHTAFGLLHEADEIVGDLDSELILGPHEDLVVLLKVLNLHFRITRDEEATWQLTEDGPAASDVLKLPS